jgi:hypothetical protein
MNCRLYVFIVLLALLASCTPRPFHVRYTEYKPVLMQRESLERSITLHTPEQIESPGKIFYKDNYILISERYKGIHIIDNTDPAKPVNKGYIRVPGCVDMAIKNSTLYVDNAVDLVAINISNIGNTEISVANRLKETFPELMPPDGFDVPPKYWKENRPKNTVIVRWEK